MQKQGNPSLHKHLKTQDFRCYDETLKAITTWIARRSQQRQAKKPITHNPKIVPLFRKSSQLGQGKVDFFPARCPFVVSSSVLSTTCGSWPANSQAI